MARALPVIVWDREAGKRRIVPMRWGFPHPKDGRRPQPIHARSETIDTTAAFAEAFATGQRGIVVFKTFNEGEEIAKPSGKTKPINGRSTRATDGRAASPSSGDASRSPICRNRCWRASW